MRVVDQKTCSAHLPLLGVFVKARQQQRSVNVRSFTLSVVSADHTEVHTVADTA